MLRTQVGSGLLHACGVVPSSHSMVGLLLRNCYEWLVVDHACIAYDLVSCPLYESFDDVALRHIIKTTSMPVVFTTQRQLSVIFDLFGEGHAVGKLKYIVTIDEKPFEEKDLQRAAALGLKLYLLKEIIEIGKENPAPHVPPKSTDVFTVCFTSGTSGLPKGVKITHQNLVAAVAGVFETIAVKANFPVGPSDRYLSFLPLGHMFERAVSHGLLSRGVRVGFFRPGENGGLDVPKLFEDLAELKPTLFASVPRLMTRIYDGLMATIGAASPITRAIFWFGVEQKRKLLRKGIVTRKTIWDWLAFGKVQQRLGGEVRIMLTGAAPISTEIMELMRIIFGINILEGYGQTESCAVVSLSDYEFPYGSHVGVPTLSQELKLIDVPSLNYFSTDNPPRGEICARGFNVMQGYLNNPEQTAETVDEDGWLHTGDVGELLPNGTIKIIDRVKALFKLAQGEYISPERIENIICLSRFSAQAFVHGDSLETTLVAVIVPGGDLRNFVCAANLIHLNADLIAHEAVRKVILDDFTAIARKQKLHSYEIPKAIHLHPTQFTVEEGLMTPTFKLKRYVSLGVKC
ncbi:hypothetical protein BJ742DRAFT_672969 [Cladochytrium replicatum]|nr:hypothetical protein BJ742DRAFT_672969 [Cladochytrium replicatum]